MTEKEKIEQEFQEVIFLKGMKLGMFKALSYMLDGKDVATLTKAKAQEYLDEHQTGFDLYQ